MKDFINRDTERKIINEAIQKLNSGTNVIIWIEGDSGVGKSYLMKYVLKSVNIPVFQFLNCKNIYKCEKQDLSQEFSFISNIMTTLQVKNPTAYHNCLYNYFDNIHRINLYEVIETVLPNFKPLQWSKDLFDKFNVQSQASKEFIMDRTLKTSMIVCLSEIIMHLLEQNYNDSNILFCIDDIIWMDNASLETMETILSKLRLENRFKYKISFFVTSRNCHELENIDEQNNYYKFESNIFDEFYTYNYNLLLTNFKIRATREYLLEKERFELLNYLQSLHNITSGNPQELTQTLKFEDYEIIKMIKTFENDTQQSGEHYFTSELIYTLQQKNTYTIYILGLLSLLEKNTKPYLLLSLCRLCIEKINRTDFDFDTYEEAINILMHKDILTYENIEIIIKHDSIKILVVDYLIESGDYQEIGNILAHFILSSEFIKDEYYTSRVNLALNILKKINPIDGLKIAIDFYNYSSSYDINNLRITAECYCICFYQVDIETVNEVIVPKIITALVSTSQYDLAYKICKIIFDKLNLLTLKNKVLFLVNYAKILIDLGYIKSNSENSGAIYILDILVELVDDDNDLLQVYLLKMSAYEHILEFSTIRDIYTYALDIINSNSDLDDKLLSTFYRNKGLIEYHANIKSDYLKACFYAERICIMNDKNIMMGTCHNNLGLSYFYSGDIEEALECFERSYHFLQDANYDLLRVLNNISMCYLMLNDFSASYDFILKAKCIPLKGIFESKSLEVNLALIMYRNNQKSEAEKRLDAIIDEYTMGNIVTDTAAYSAAMVNRAYIYFNDKQYLKAYQLYKMSKCHKYKNTNEIEQWKRDCLCNYCLYKENILDNVSNQEIDFDEKHNFIHKRPYSAILFAYYII